MKKIVVPIDFSACSAHAFQLAVQVAGKTGAALHALHVIFPNEGGITTSTTPFGQTITCSSGKKN